MRGRQLWYRGIARPCVSAITTMALVASLVPARASAMDGAGADVPVVVAGDADSEAPDPIAIDVSDGDGQAADGGLEVVEAPDGEALDEGATAQAQDGAGGAVEESPVLRAEGATTSDWDLSKYNTARGSLGFFEYMGAKGAISELTGQRNFDYFGNGRDTLDARSLAIDATTGKPIIESTNIGADGDATSLENMRESIEWIRVSNEYRALWNEYNGYQPEDNNYAAPLRVNDLLMAEAQIATNLIGACGTTQHSGYGEGTENAAWGYGDENPFEGWYDAELAFKNREDKTQTSIIYNGWTADTVGHLNNLVNPLGTVTGFAITQNGTGNNPTVYTQRIGKKASRKATVSTIERYSAARGETPSYDVDDYYEQFMAYYDAVKAAEAAAAGVPYVPFQTDMAAATVSVSPVTYTGQPREPRPSVTLNGNTLIASRDYTVAFANNVNAGTATVTVTGKGSYSGTKTSTFQISPASIADATVGSVAAQTYTGSAIRPSVVVTRGGATLREGTDYTLSYSNNVSAGTATITVSGKGNYGGTKRQTFLIRPTSISGASVTADKQTHTGGALRPDPVVTLGGKELVLGSDYYVYSYANNVDVGTATVTVMGRGNYTGTASGTFVIEPRPKTDISGASVSAPAQTYTGSALRPTPTVRLGSKTLAVGTDYTVTYASNTNAGTATMTVTGTGDYVGTVTGGFEIRAASIAGATASATEQTYTGSALKPAVTVRLGSKTLVGGTDYTVSYANNTNAGTATATVTGKGNYTGTTQCSFKVKAADIASASVSAPDQTYTGSALKPTPTVRLGSKTLASGTDYTVSYASNTNAGTATVTVTGKGNYAGTATSDFAIKPLSIVGAGVSAPGQTYTGQTLWPTVTVTLGGKTLASGTDYTVAYANNTNVGTATITVTGKGNYTGKATGSFSISARPKVDISGATASASDQTYTGGALTPAVTVRLGSKTLTSGTDYTVAYASNTNVGTASFTVTGRGDYTGSVTGGFGIKAASIASASVTVADQTYTGSALRPAVTVRLGSRTLTSGTDYTVAYANNTNVGTATVTVTGKGNYTGTVKKSFAITAKPKIDISGATASASDQTYTGSALTPTVTVKLGTKTLVGGTDYTVAYASNTNAGTATVTVTGTGDYTGTVTSSFRVRPASLSGAGVAVADQTYTGSALKPAVTVTLGSKTLASGTDYTVAYANNTNVGTATATVTGKGNYTGKAQGTFTITSKALTDISGATIVVADQTYTGSPIRPNVSLTLRGRGVPADGYTLTYANNTNMGMAVVMATGRGDYTGTARGRFLIGPAGNFFIDADRNDWGNHGNSVDWMGRIGISTGWVVPAGREYRGLSDVKRCDFAAFLYRMADLLDDDMRNDSVALPDARARSVLGRVRDCDAGTPHAAEVAWLIDSGISRGWSDDGGRTLSFRPYANVARQDMAAFIYRFVDLTDNDRMDASPKNGYYSTTFTDVRAGDEANHASEVLWMASRGITRGFEMRDGTRQFRGTSPVARQDMAAFMERTYMIVR